MARITWAIAISLTSVACAASRGPTVAKRDVLTHDVRPELARVVRDGDPIGALAIAGLPPNDALPFVSSYEVVKNIALSLEKAGFRATGEAGPDGWRLLVELDEISASDAATQTFERLRTLSTAHAVNFVSFSNATTLEPLDAIGRCSGRPSVSAAEQTWLKHPSLPSIRSWLEGARRTNRVVVAVVGNTSVVDSVTHSWEQDVAWAAGELNVATPPMSGTAKLGDETVLAIPVQAPASSVARSLGSDAATLRAAGAILHGVSAHSVVGGYCVLVRFSAPATETDRIAQYISSEVTFRAMHLPTEDALGSAKRESDPRKAAAVSAWRRLVDRTIRERAMAPKSQPVPAHAATEIGQHEVHVIVASECPLVNESRREWGAAAATVRAAALGAEGDGSTTVEPWTSKGQIGVYVHGAALPGEDGALLAARLTGLATRALWGAAPSRAHVERGLRWVQAQASSQRSLLLGALAESNAPTRPSIISPFGREGLGASYSDIVATHRSFRTMHFSLAILSNEGSDQIAAATAATARAETLFGVHPKECSVPKEGAPSGDALRVAAGSGKDVNWLTYTVDRSKRAAARVLAQTMSGSGFPSALYETRAGAWLITEIAASERTAEQEMDRLRNVLLQLGRGGGDLVRARRELRIMETDPRERLVQLLDEKRDASDTDVHALANDVMNTKPVLLTARAEHAP